MIRKARRLNLLDTVILTALAAAVAIGAVLLMRAEKRAPAGVEIECVLLLPPAENDDPIRVGDTVRNENGTVRMGQVTDVRKRPHRELILLDGQAVYAEIKGQYETELTVRMRAEDRPDDGIRVGDIRVRAGEKGSYRVGSVFVAGAEVISVSLPGGGTA